MTFKFFFFTGIWQQLGQAVVFRRSLQSMLHHGASDDFLGPLVIADHDALVHDDALGLGTGLFDGDSNDVKL